MLDLRTIEALSREMRRLEVDRGGIPLMAPKGVVRAILVEDVPTKAANIIKQEALARGGDVATPWTAADFAAETVDLIVIGNVVTLRSLVAKLYRQVVYNLPEFADALQDVLLKTVPGYLPVARRPGRQGQVVEETLEDLFGGVIPVARGRAVALPTLVPPPGRADFEWRFGRRTYVAGVLPLNMGGGATDGAAERVLAHAATAMHAAGVDMLEIGPATPAGWDGNHVPAESTRLATVLREVQGRLPVALVGLDTGSPALVRAAAAGGAQFVRTGAAFLRDGALREVLAESGMLVTVVHQEEREGHGTREDLLSRIAHYFWNVLDVATRAGIRPERILLDPGVGAGKTPDENRECTRRLRELTSFGRPLVYTPGTVTPASMSAAVTLAITNGADFVRGTDAAALAAAARAADGLIRAPDGSG